VANGAALSINGRKAFALVSDTNGVNAGGVNLAQKFLESDPQTAPPLFGILLKPGGRGPQQGVRGSTFGDSLAVFIPGNGFTGSGTAINTDNKGIIHRVLSNEQN
jgi:hypothetical protein